MITRIASVLVGAYPHERLWGHAGNAPRAINTRITSKIVNIPGEEQMSIQLLDRAESTQHYVFSQADSHIG